MISSKFWNLETLTLHKRPSLWQEYLTTYEIHSLFQVAAGPSADIDKKRFRHKRFPNFCEKSIMQSKKSFPISTSYYTSFPVMIDAIMRPTKHAKFACSWWDTRMFGRWKSLASQSHAHFWSALKKRLLMRYFMSRDKDKHSFAQLDRTLNQHHVNKKNFPVGTQWWLSLHPSSFCWPYFRWLELLTVSWSFYLSKLRCHLEYCCQKFTSLIELCLHRKRNMEWNWRGGAWIAFRAKFPFKTYVNQCLPFAWFKLV